MQTPARWATIQGEITIDQGVITLEVACTPAGEVRVDEYCKCFGLELPGEVGGVSEIPIFVDIVNG